MMSAPSIPTPQGAMPAGFATFLANIGQLPADGGESPSFDRLLAAAPGAAVPIANATATIKIDPVLAIDAAAAQIETPVESDVEDPAAKAAPVKADPAALAANLLIALNGAIPGAAPATGKPVPAKPGTDAAASETTETGETVPTAPPPNWDAIVAVAIPAVPKPARPSETGKAAADNSAPALPVAARPRDAAMPTLNGAEAPVAKSPEAASSMTILFTQPTAPGAATLAEAAAPAAIAEQVIDIDSDGAWIDQLARDIAATKSESGDISFRLMPKHLGRLDVAMQMGDEGMSLKMDTHHEATATIVTAAQGRLVDELRQQGVRVTGSEVTCTPGETGRQSQSQGQGRAAAPDPSHLIETATERAEPRDEDRAADRRGRFA
ncbi:flagellar hook-length control protein [Sphingopyxis fribergensis]|uniref:Flagellar hook-length control protein n=1 Tax=Sphingopyxis fribergensis TaxID=1515612 RepID=A0A0A7PNK6_9SPHN|nr:flagellar hook-length control protein FliK [Sphingopyxis fribergensis]AJA10788.1 flagellar hook-length control protein [Sphingopyxis fribergensis]